MKVEVRTHTYADGHICQDLLNYEDPHEIICRQIINTKDEQIQRALHMLGWRHESENAVLLIPNVPTEQNPQGGGFHRVTVDDVRKMEKQIRRIAAALHL